MNGKTINGFTLQRLLGVGGMAEVWYAENEIGLPAAVKILSKELSVNEQMRDRFLNEAKVMVQLNHPNIRKVLGFGNIDERPAIIMEYLDGNDLKARMKRGQRFTQAELEQWWDQLVDALNYTHKKGIVHRDIKPSNIFVDEEGNVKLLDFGIAKFKASISMTQTGAMMGTLMYMSPEQVQDAKHLGPASDVYSLAVSFVHLLTGKTPYDSSSLSDFKIRECIVYKPLDMTGVPTEWQTFLLPYLAKDPDERPTLRPFDPTVKEVPAVVNPKVAPNVAVVPDTDEGTVVMDSGKPKQPQTPVKAKENPTSEPDNKPKGKKGLWIGLAVAAVVAVALFVLLKPDPDTQAFKACQTVKDYRSYINNYGYTAKHYAEAKQFVDKHVADSIAEEKRLEEEKKEDEIYYYYKCSTIADCDTYLNKYPNGNYVTEVKAKKTELERQEDESFNNCTNLVACNKYLKEYPNGRYVNQVKMKKANFEAELAQQTPPPIDTNPNSNSSTSTTSSSTAKPGFSISSSKRVYFAPGNLQYHPYNNQWRIAANPWDCIGEANENISKNYNGWIDLFGWFTGDNPTNSSTSSSDYSNFTDWGSKMGKGYRTLTKAEWEYVFNKRSTPSGIRYAKAKVNGVSGVILLPDNWSKSTYNLSNTNKYDASDGGNSISATTWNNTFAPAGAVFLPAAGCRGGTSVNDVGSNGYYWSASPDASYSAYGVYFSDGSLSAHYWNYRYYGQSVRLARPAE